MGAFAEQSKISQPTTSAKFTMPGQIHSGQRREVDSILHLQRTVGNQAVQRMLQANPEKLKASNPVVARQIQRRPTAKSLKQRQRAVALKAADARTLLQTSLPFVLEHMTGEQIQQVQKVLDAAVVNPEVQKEANDLYNKSIVSQSGPLTVRDPKKVRRAEQAMENFIPVAEADKRVRLDHKALLAPEALQPRTDNPDEAA